MPTFPRTKPPRLVTPPKFPKAMAEWGLSGKAQTRSFGNMGREWQETWPVIEYKSADIRELIALLNYGMRNGIVWDVQHPHLKANYGTGSGSPTVNGGGQTGDTLSVSGLSGTLAAGDIIKIAGDNLIYDVRADSSGGSIPISPPIFAGNSPSNGAAVTINAANISFKAIIVEVTMPDVEADGLAFAGLTAHWREQA